MFFNEILNNKEIKHFFISHVLIKNDMKKDTFAVYVTTLVLIVYAVIAYTELSYRLVFLLFTISPVLILWMVYSVLKSPDEPTRTFDEYFYMDSDKKPMKRI